MAEKTDDIAMELPAARHAGLSAADRGTLRSMIAANVFGLYGEELRLAADELRAAVLAHGDDVEFIRRPAADRLATAEIFKQKLLDYRRQLAFAFAAHARDNGFRHSGETELVPCPPSFSGVLRRGVKGACGEEFCPLCVARALLLPTLSDLMAITLKPDGTPSGDYRIAFRRCRVWFQPKLTLSECETALTKVSGVSARTLIGAAAIKQIRLIAPPEKKVITHDQSSPAGITGELIEVILLPAGDKLAALTDKDRLKVNQLRENLGVIAVGKAHLLNYLLADKVPAVESYRYSMHVCERSAAGSSGPGSLLPLLTSTQLAWTLSQLIRPPVVWYGEQQHDNFLLGRREVKLYCSLLRRKANKKMVRRAGVNDFGRLARGLGARPGSETIRKPRGSRMSSSKLQAADAKKLGLRLFCSLIGQKAPTVALRVVQQKLTKHLKEQHVDG